MRLPRGPVEGHHPVVRVLLVLGGEEDAVALADRVEEVLPALEICFTLRKRMFEVSEVSMNGVAGV